jgi:ABC-2 type transport system permease protein
MTLIFFFTPIIWDVKQLPAQYKMALIEPNILYHYIEIYRSSLINGNVNRLSFLIVIIFTFLSSLLNLFIFKKFKKKLVLWI